MNEQFTLEGFEPENVEEEKNDKKKDNYLGAWGEAKTLCFFLKEQLDCFTPINEKTSADLLARIPQNNKVKTVAIQIKARRIWPYDGEFRVTKSNGYKDKRCQILYPKTAFDMVAFVVQDIDEIFFHIPKITEEGMYKGYHYFSKNILKANTFKTCLDQLGIKR
jgi:hypothetical protein